MQTEKGLQKDKRERYDMKTNERIKRLPENIQEEVKETLKAFTGCYVEQNEETGEYMVSTGIGITKEHNPWKLIEDFENTDIYTNEEIEKYADEVWAGCDMSAW